MARPASVLKLGQNVWLEPNRLTIVVVADAIPILIFAFVEMEHIEEVADRRAVERHIGIVIIDNRVLQIVPAAAGLVCSSGKGYLPCVEGS
jgi:hypothetical protein